LAPKKKQYHIVPSEERDIEECTFAPKIQSHRTPEHSAGPKIHHTKTNKSYTELFLTDAPTTPSRKPTNPPATNANNNRPPNSQKMSLSLLR
jgi:hypothetical protein